MDNRPKRRKSKDNPYTLESIIEEKKYRVNFKDVNGVIQDIEINEKIFKTLDKFELEDLKILNEYDRHIEHIEQTEESLYKKICNDQLTIVDRLIEEENITHLHKQILKLPEVQRRRLKMYFFDDLTLEEIGKIEKCSKVAVKHSIDNAIKKLKKYLNI